MDKYLLAQSVSDVLSFDIDKIKATLIGIKNSLYHQKINGFDIINVDNVYSNIDGVNKIKNLKITLSNGDTLMALKNKNIPPSVLNSIDLYIILFNYMAGVNHTGKSSASKIVDLIMNKH